MTAETCRHCERPLRLFYPDAAFDLAWTHTSAEDARNCPSDYWPVPERPFCNRCGAPQPLSHDCLRDKGKARD